MYKKGNDLNQLLKLLKSMSELTGLDRVIRTNQSFHIDAEIRGRKLYWLWMRMITQDLALRTSSHQRERDSHPCPQPLRE